ncbi:MAG: radical SAM protein [Pseudomonadota bacterium]
MNSNRPSAAAILHREPTGQVKLLEYERRYFDVMTAHFGDRFLRYRRDWSESSNFSLKPDFPLSLDLEVNASCNLRCVMCVLGGTERRRAAAGPPLMDLGLYRDLMDQARAAGLPAMTFGFLSEPLLSPDLAEMIRLAREAGVMDIRLGTNGLLLTRDASQRLGDAGLTRLEVSLDALKPETYARIRRGGRFEQVVRNIDDFLDAREKNTSGLPLLRLSFLRLPHNRGELDGFLAFWKDRADLFSVQEPIYFEDAPLCRELTLVETAPSPDFRCAQPWQRLIVRTSGDVFPCCSIYGLEMNAGSAGDQPLVGIWNSPLMEDLRRLHRLGLYSENKTCFHCAARSSIRAAFPEQSPKQEENICPRIG